MKKLCYSCNPKAPSSRWSTTSSKMQLLELSASTCRWKSRTFRVISPAWKPTSDTTSIFRRRGSSSASTQSLSSRKLGGQISDGFSWGLASTFRRVIVSRPNKAWHKWWQPQRMTIWKRQTSWSCLMPSSIPWCRYWTVSGWCSKSCSRNIFRCMISGCTHRWKTSTTSTASLTWRKSREFNTRQTRPNWKSSRCE